MRFRFQLPTGVSGCDAVRILIGSVLLAAAAAKGHELVSASQLGGGLFDSQPVLFVAVLFESLLGIWLLTGIWRHWSWIGAVACFVCFVAVATHKAISGAASCECMGKLLIIHPWYMVVADVGALSGLMVWHPLKANQGSSTDSGRPWTCATWVVATCTAIAIPTASAILRNSSGVFADSDIMMVGDDLVDLEPTTWIGKRLPLLPYIDIRSQLAKGDWIVVFYRSDCAACQAALPNYKRFAKELNSSSISKSVALIDMHPQGQTGHSGELPDSTSPLTYGSIIGGRRWFFQVPLRVDLTDGIVHSFPTEL